MLQASSRALWDEYDLALLDLDGVAYIGPAAVPGAPENLAKASGAGLRVAFVTNNASRPPAAVARHLDELGIPTAVDDVVTSAQAAARLLSDDLPEGARVFVIGGDGLFEALDDVGLRPVQDFEPEPDAVVSGYSPELAWKTVTDGAILVRRGLPWVATNTDLTVPTAHGPGPGNGVVVDAVARFAHREPVVAGKPEPVLFRESVRRVGGRRPLVVGDRLDTDIAGAVNAGYDSLLVMTGVTGVEELARAGSDMRPSYVSADLAGLGRSHGVPRPRGRGAELGGWSAEVSDGRLTVTGRGDVDDWWRVVADASWRFLDDTGEPVGVCGLSAPVAWGDGAGRTDGE